MYEKLAEWYDTHYWESSKAMCEHEREFYKRSDPTTNYC
jgi:hypothetical protein